MDFASLLREVGLRVTGTRLALLEMVEEGGRHMTADAITNALHEQDIRVDRVTVYRNIDRMIREGLFVPIQLPGKALSVGLCKRPKDPHHHHIYCQTCGRLAEAPGCIVTEHLSELKALIQEKTGFAVTGHILQYIGTCPTCREKSVMPK